MEQNRISINEQLGADALKKEFARNYVNSLPQDLIGVLGGLVHIRRSLHLGVDAFGNRFTSEERRILSRTKDQLFRKIRDRWVEEGKPGPEGPEQHYRTYDPYVRAELVDQCLRGSSTQ